VSFLPINLGVRRSSQAEGADAEKGTNPSANAAPSKAQVEKTLKRDDHTCRFCGFRSEQYQRVMPYASADASLPFVTACTFCEQCMMLERAGMMGSGSLIWLPEITQMELNHIARAIYIARGYNNNAAEGPVAELANRALDALMARRSEAKKRLGSDDPLLLATVMHEVLTDDEIATGMAKIDGIRLLPLDKHLVRSRQGDVNHFPTIVKYWCSPEGPFAHQTPDLWAESFKAAAAKAGNA
jgi:intracellular multiplication protein IcmJ